MELFGTLVCVWQEREETGNKHSFQHPPRYEETGPRTNSSSLLSLNFILSMPLISMITYTNLTNLYIQPTCSLEVLNCICYCFVSIAHWDTTLYPTYPKLKTWSPLLPAHYAIFSSCGPCKYEYQPSSNYLSSPLLFIATSILSLRPLNFTFQFSVESILLSLSLPVPTYLSCPPIYSVVHTAIRVIVSKHKSNLIIHHMLLSYKTATLK